MNELILRFRDYLDSRTPRERWLLGSAAAVVALFTCYTSIIAPLASHAEESRQRATDLDTDVLQARRLASEIRSLQGRVEAIESSIVSGERTNLLALLETLAARSSIQKNQIESIKPTPVSGNSQYPETKVSVILRGTTLQQIIRLLHAIESSESHLIMRSLQVRKARRGGDGDKLLDVTFSVSSFERA